MMKNRRRLKVLANRATEVHGEFDAELKATPLPEVSCKAGCSACCRQLIAATVPEAARIVDQRRELVVARRSLLEQQADWFHGKDIFTMKGLEALTHSYWDAYMPCVFLDENDGCSIYDLRPLACRSYFVTSDPELCNVRDSDVTVIQPERALFQSLEKMAVAETQVMKTQTLAPLPVLLLYLLGEM